jgi:hypothetical protein
MPLWKIESLEWPTQNFSGVDPLDVLIEYDGPLTFTFKDVVGNLMLAHLCASESDRSRYVVVPTDDAIISELKEGTRSIAGALTQPLLWLIDVANDGAILGCWAQRVADLPAGAIPKPNVLLYEDLAEKSKTAKFLRSGSQGQIAFDGAPVSDHKIDLGFYGKFLDRFQNLFDATANAMFGALVGNLRGGLAIASSYAIDLIPPTTESDHLINFINTKVDPDRPTQVFDRVVSMMVDKKAPAETVDIVTREQKVRLQYGSVLELMSHNGATILMRTRQMPDGRKLTNYEAGERFRSIKALGFPFGNISVEGKLIGGLIKKSGKAPVRFDIESERVTYHGKISEAALEKMEKCHLGDDVIAKLKVEAEGDNPQTYELLDIDPVA